jgi:hypothetical protein
MSMCRSILSNALVRWFDLGLSEVVGLLWCLAVAEAMGEAMKRWTDF